MPENVNIFIALYGNQSVEDSIVFRVVENTDSKIYNLVNNACQQALANKQKVKVLQLSNDDIMQFILATPITDYREGSVWDFTE